MAEDTRNRVAKFLARTLCRERATIFCQNVSFYQELVATTRVGISPAGKFNKSLLFFLSKDVVSRGAAMMS